MKFRMIIRPAVLLLLLILAACGPPAQEFVKFSSAEGRFSILMPGNPTEGKLSIYTSDLIIPAHSFRALGKFIGVMCGYYDFPSPPGSVERIFDTTRDGSIRSIHGALLEEENLTFDGHPGRRFRSIGQGNVYVDEEMILVDHRFYLITVTTTSKDRDKNIVKVFDSFRLEPQSQ